MAISFAEIDSQAANLKKARAALSLLLEAMPVDDANEDYAWIISIAHGIVHDTIKALEAEVASDLKSRGKGAQAKA